MSAGASVAATRAFFPLVPPALNRPCCSKTYPIQASAIKKGGFAVLGGRPCKIIGTSTSKTGKHGSAKIHFIGTDIFTGKKVEEISPSTANMEAPNVKKEEMPLVSIEEEGFCSLMTADGSTKEDLKLPQGELGDEIRKAFEEGDDKEIIVTIQSAMDEEAIIGWKYDTK